MLLGSGDGILDKRHCIVFRAALAKFARRIKAKSPRGCAKSASRHLLTIAVSSRHGESRGFSPAACQRRSSPVGRRSGKDCLKLSRKMYVAAIKLCC